MSDDEMIDCVSDDDSKVLGTIKRSLALQEPSLKVRVVNAFIINQEGKLWIPTRSPTKKLFPLALEASVGGFVKSGENYEEALIREALEETGLNPKELGYELIAKLSPKEHGISAFTHLYLMKYVGDIPYNPEDFISYEWITPSQLLMKLEAGIFAKSDLIKILKASYEILTNPIHYRT